MIQLNTNNPDIYIHSSGIIQKLAHASIAEITSEDTIFKVLIGTDEVSLTFNNFVKKMDNQSVIKEINRLKGFLVSIDKKLNNEKFMNNANPSIIANEMKKKSDTELKIKSLQKQIESSETI